MVTETSFDISGQPCDVTVDPSTLNVLPTDGGDNNQGGGEDEQNRRLTTIDFHYRRIDQLFLLLESLGED